MIRKTILLFLFPSLRLFGQLESAEKPDSTSVQFTTRYILTQKDFQRLPGRGIENALLQTTSEIYSLSHRSEQTNFHVRGGFDYELGTRLNGFYLNDPLSGKRLIDIPQIAIDRLVLTTGPMTADQGRFTSGMIDITPMTGGDKLRFSGETYTDQLATLYGGTSYKKTISSFTISGPAMDGKLRYFAAGEYLTTADAEPSITGNPTFRIGQGVRTYNHDNDINTPGIAVDTVFWRGFKDGPRAFRANAQEKFSYFGGLNMELSDQTKMMAMIVGTHHDRNIFSNPYLLAGHHGQRQLENALHANSTFYHTFSNRLKIEGGLFYYQSFSENGERSLLNDVEGNLLEPHQRGGTGNTSYNGDNVLFDVNRYYTEYWRSEIQTIGGQGRVLYKLDDAIQFDGGVEYAANTARMMTLYEAYDVIAGANDIIGYRLSVNEQKVKIKHGTPQNSAVPGVDGVKKPSLLSFYQNTSYLTKVLSFNLGLRLDRFNSGSRQLKDLSQPTGQNFQLGPEDYESSKTKNSVSGSLHGFFSPNEAFHLRGSFGKYTSVMAAQNYYINSDFLERMSLNPPFTAVINNPNLKHPVLFTVEVGGGANLEIIKVDGLVFLKTYKDIVETNAITSMPSGLIITDNTSEAAALGVTGTADAYPHSNIHGRLAFTVERCSTRGNPGSGFRSAWLGFSDAHFTVPSDHVRTYRILSTADIHFAKNEGPKLGRIYPFEDGSLTISFELIDGFPYTPTTRVPIQVSGVPAGRPIALRNSKTTDSYAITSFKLQKKIDWDPASITFYLDCYNVFNVKAPVNVFSATGEPDNNDFLASAEFLTYDPIHQERARPQYLSYFKDGLNYLPTRQIILGISIDY